MSRPRGAAPPVVALLERRGRWLNAVPFFDRAGRRLNVDKDRRSGPGDLVVVAPSGPRSGHGKVVRRLGRPDVARDVLEGLMLDRGLRRRFDPAVERAAREAAARPPGGDVGDVHPDPGAAAVEALGRQRVVEVAGGRRVDREGRQVPQVAAAG
ncbi:MAG TPA: hypothetical protein VM844_00150, partial [Miltoncostaeaceae bacterium]|nr:hypothetical protein [Miltoncostaeaceae bacterium]